MIKINKKNKAYSLIELIVAIGVLSIGVLSIVAFYAKSASLSHLASNKSVAANLAQGIIDEKLSTSYPDLTPGDSTIIRVSTDPQSSYYNFYKQTKTTLIDSDLNPSETDLGLKKIEVIITYSENGYNKNVTLATIKAQR